MRETRLSGRSIARRLTRKDSDHIKELNNAQPKQPFFFLKPPSSILLPGAGPVLRPKGVDMHYEIELAAIIGKQIRNLDPNDEKGAFEAIKGVYKMNLLFPQFHSATDN